MIDLEKLLEKIKEEMLAEIGDVELIFVSGSYALGMMGPYSDIDIKVLTAARPKRKRLFRFVKCGKRNLLLTVHFDKFAHAMKEIRKPEEWVWAYEYYRKALVLYDRDYNMEKILAELERHKVSQDYFFRFIPEEASYLPEYVGKLKNAYHERDELNLFYAARVIAEICYNLLRPFNLVWKYTSEKEAYRAFLSLKNKPKDYVKDFKICYGITTERRPLKKVYESALRLARETIEFLTLNRVEERIKDKDFIRFFKSKEF
ncbi:MAG: nucleotidyltransferase domain-containing protein [Candidatus Bathyarchaeia archaeon]